MRILLVEDDKIIGDGVSQGLQLESYAVDWVTTVKHARGALDLTTYDLMILDIGLPDGSGFDVLDSLRRTDGNMPVLILTAYDETSDKVKGLDLGADDYLIKPFDLEELLARVRALRRRASGRRTPQLQLGPVILIPSTHQVTLAGELVKVGPKEFAILHVLMERAGKVVSKRQIEDSLYGWDMEVESNTIEVHIHGLRKKLGKTFIETVRHVGYRVATDA
ncbi:response regulator [Exilibacterium tricleocarpae]|uniref:Response regulator n=1 Tax=Exilibacterium tricleocarpae TaxID=2591008 RepID=A0A545U6R8_9GAMM|nr:response regulator [Exilibacterium tricleocarpae]TQV85169.1 response regulator [Exilibacterium tricleocarpae]